MIYTIYSISRETSITEQGDIFSKSSGNRVIICGVKSSSVRVTFVGVKCVMSHSSKSSSVTSAESFSFRLTSVTSLSPRLTSGIKKEGGEEKKKEDEDRDKERKKINEDISKGRKNTKKNRHQES